MTAFPTDHLAPPEVLSGPAPLGEVAPAPRRTPAEEARTLVAQNRMAALATLSEDGSPWGSLVLYAALEDGTPVLCLSTLAEHGRNITRDPRASLVVGEADVTGDPLDSGRVTLAGRLETPDGEELAAARVRVQGRLTRLRPLRPLRRLHVLRRCASSACAGWEAMAAWTPPTPAPSTPPSPTRSRAAPPTRSSTSTTTTPTPCC